MLDAALCFFFEGVGEDTLLGELVGIKSIRYAHVIYISAFFLRLCRPDVCLYLFYSYANRENSFSLFVSDVRMGSSKISPPALLSASLLYFTTQQHFPGSSGLVLS